MIFDIFMDLRITTFLDWISSGKLTTQWVFQHYMEKAKHDKYNAYVRLHEEYADSHVEAFADLPLAGCPIAVKDIFLTKWYITSCSSKMLEEYVSPYSSTVFSKLEEAWWLMLGKTNMDEFAMWTSNESSYFGAVKNPRDVSRVAWGSSWWSAAAVAWDLCVAALGTDTWWSVRLPAALCGLVWLKPTYGRASRYGIQAMSSSLDQPWVITKSVDDAAILMSYLAGFDPQDATSVDKGWESSWRTLWWVKDFSQCKIWLPKQFIEWLDDRIFHQLMFVLDGLKEKWVQVEEIDLPLLAYGVPTYYIINPAEVSSNMARFDWLRFWHQAETGDFDSISDYYEQIRVEGFWSEVQRRIMVWWYVLSAWFYDAYYLKAQKVRTKMIKDMDKVFSTYDVIIWPTSPTPAWKLWSIIDDPVKNYLIDIYTVVANLTWCPAMSVPMGTVKEEWVDLPVWCQIISQRWDESVLFELGREIEGLF